MTPRIRHLVLAAALAVGSLAAVAPAQAGTSQLSIIQDDGQFIDSGADVRRQRLDEVDALGVDVVKVLLNWRRVAPANDSETKPAFFDARNPAAYSNDAFAGYDDLVREATARGLTVQFMLGGTAPDWASGPGRPGKVRPNGPEFGQFTQAVGARYSGTFTGAGPALPRVRMWSIWNEPNIPGWISPQFTSRRVPVSPRIYRDLLKAGDAGLRASGHGGDTILLGELAPFSSDGNRTRMRPLLFLRELACVDSRYRAYRGSAARARGCSSRGSSPKLPGTALAYHPYTFRAGPRLTNLPPKDDATYAQISRITSTLDRLRKRFRSTSRKRVYMTESGYQTSPPEGSRSGISLSNAARFLGEGEWMLYRNRRIASTAQYPLVDDSVVGGDFGGFQSGLRFGPGSGREGEEKPLVYDSYRSPFFTRRSGSRVEFFGAARPLSSGRTVELQRRSGSNWVRVATLRVNSRGYFRSVRSASRSATYRFQYQDGFVVRTSRATKPAAR